MVVPLRSQVRLRLSRLSVQHGRSASSHRPALTLARCSVAAHCALLRVLATPALRASDVRKLTRGAPCFTGLIDGYCSHWLRRLFRPHWAYSALLRSTIHNGRLAAPNGLQRSLVHWTSASPVPRTARGEAPSHRARASCAPRASSRFAASDCALRFAPCARHFSPSGLRCSQAHSRLSLPYWAYYGLFPPLAAAFVRPFSLREKRRLWDRATSYGSATSQKAPLSQRGAGGGAD